jgi:hypothetical protein
MLKEAGKILLSYLFIAVIIFLSLFPGISISIEKQHGIYLPVVTLHSNAVYADTTGNLSIAAGADDGYANGDESGTYGTTTTITIRPNATEANARDGFLRWEDAALQQLNGATIDAATIGVYINDTNNDMNCNIYGDARDNAPNFTTSATVRSRPRTVASVTWSSNNSGSGYWLTSPDIKTIVQEEADAGNFTSGVFAVMLIAFRATANEARFSAYEMTDNMCMLSITYTVSASAPTMTTNEATNIHSINATLNGRVTAAGGDNPDCWFYWDTSDKGEVEGDWTNNVTMGEQSGSFSTNITGLTDCTTYVYRVKGTNVTGTDWGEAQSFVAKDIYSFHIDSCNLDTLKALKTESTHSALWSELAGWGGLHYNDIPPTQSAVSADFKANAEDIYEHIEKFIFLYLMTDNTSYADSAVTWMMNVTDNWTGWFPGDEADPQHFRSLAAGLSDGYLCFGDYMGSANKTKLFNNLATYSYPTYVDYIGDGPPITWPAKNSAIVEVLGSVSLALGADSENSTDYMTLVLQCIGEAIAYGGGSDGGWTEGPSYGIISGVFTRLFVFLDAYERIEGVDMFDDYEGFLSNLPYYFLYLTQPDDHYLGRVPIQIEDTTGRQTLFNQFDTALSWLYKSANEYIDNNTQYMAEQWASNNTTLDYIWKSSTITANATTSLPLYRVFNSTGYAVFKAGWGDDDTTIVFKSGQSSYHAVPDQNTYMVYQYGRPLTAGIGYTVGSEEYRTSLFDNCISAGYFLGGDGNLYGRGQDQGPENGNLDWGVGGNITSSNFTTVYFHVEGDASDVYTAETTAETGDWPTSTGNITTHLRHLVYLPDLDILVVYDYVVSPIEQQINWCFANRDLYNEDSTDNPPALEWNSNVLTNILDGDANVAVERRMEIKLLEPETFTTYSANVTPTNNNQEFRRTIAYPSDNGTTQNFLAVEAMNDSLSTGSVNATRISQNNLIGTKINDASYTWLVLFSTDNASVSETLDLGAEYQAADGETYSITGDTIQIDFSSGYQVIKLEAGAESGWSAGKVYGKTTMDKIYGILKSAISKIMGK